MASTPTATSPSTAAARHNLTNRSRPLKKLRISGKITHGPKTESEKLHPKPRNPRFLCPTMGLVGAPSGVYSRPAGQENSGKWFPRKNFNYFYIFCLQRPGNLW